MKINSIYISAFGGLKDFTLELSDGLNVIYGENENGKSTVAAFIKAMFYGTGKKTQQLSTSIRQKYTPWDSSVMGGRIYFENGGTRYCLEREFRKSDSTDRMMLTNLDSGEAQAVSENIGPKFFGVGDKAFERSMFIGSTGAFSADDDAVGELNARLSNIAFTGDEDVSYRKISKRLEDAKFKIISKNGKGGSLNEEKANLAALKERFSAADEAVNKRREYSEILTQKQEQLDGLLAKAEELKTVIDSENDIKNREKLALLIETEKQLQKVNSGLRLKDGGILAKPFIAAVNFGITKYDKITARCNEIKGDIERMEQSIAFQSEHSPEELQDKLKALESEAAALSSKREQLNGAEAECQTKLEDAKRQMEEIANKKSGVNPITLVLSIIFAALSPVGYFAVNTYAAVASVLVAAVLLTLSFVLRPNNKSAVLNAEKQIADISSDLATKRQENLTVQQQINNITVQINLLASSINADAAVREQRLADLNAKKEAFKTESAKRQAAQDEVLQYFGRYQDAQTLEEITDSLEVLATKTEKQGELKMKLSLLRGDLGDITAVEAQNRLFAMSDNSQDSGVDFEAVKAQYDGLSEDITACREEITALNTELKTGFKNAENPEDLKTWIAESEEKIASRQEFYDAAQITLSVLEESFNELRRGFGSEVEKLTLDIFSRLTGGRYNHISVSKLLDMAVESSDVFGTRELGYLSQGTIDQAYLSLRLALSRLISKDESLPVILDDSLSQYDDRRSETAIGFLKEFCEDSQGMLFTCHNSICEAAEKSGIEIKRPY